MKMFKTLLAVAALALFAVPVSGCASFGHSVSQVSTIDEKALITVELAESFVITAVQSQIAAGAVTQAQAAAILPAMRSMESAVVHARQLYDSGNAAAAAIAANDAVAQIVAVTTLLQQLGVIQRAPTDPGV